MNPELSEFQVKRIEESISRIGAKIADAVDLSRKAKWLSVNSEALLIDVQQELEELYVSMGDTSTEPK